jgi:putative phage-type endonuclease
MKIYDNVPQHLENGDANPDWLALRAGKFSASDFNQYMPIVKKGELSETAENNLYKKALESVGYDFDGGRVTDAMARGTELEPLARAEYMATTFEDVQEVEFVDWKQLRAGCSPDGVIYAPDGAIKKIVEIKCPEIKNYLKMAQGKIPPLYQCQVQFQLLVTGAESCDFVVWHPDMRLIITEIKPDADFQKDIVTALEKLNARYDEILNEIEQYKK